MVITRSKARSRQTLDCLASPRANTPGSASASNQNILQQPFHEWCVSSSTQDPGSHLTTSLAVGNEREPAIRKCRVDCLSCPDLSRSLEAKSNITGRTHSSINIKSHEIHCEIRNYNYLLTCKICGIQYVSESITPVNLRMNVHRKGKSGCEHSINHYKNICKGKARRRLFHKWSARLCCAKASSAKRRLLDEETAHHISLWSQ